MVERPLRVLLVAAETTGGIGRHVGLLAERLPAHDLRVSVAGPRSALDVVAGTPNIATYDVPVGSFAGARRALRELVGEVDVIHAHGLRAGVLAASARGRSSARLVVTWHNAPLVSGPRLVAHRVASAYAARRADVTLGASPDLTAAARRAGARDARDTFVVAPPTGSAARTGTVVRAELGVGVRPVILAVGRLQAQKRLDVLVDAASRWAGQPGGPVVVIAGSGPDEVALRARADASGADVRLLGARTDVADLMAAADVVALPSAWEARSLVAQEALRTGVPLVTTPVGGLPELVGDAALLVPVGDAPALGAALDRLLADAELRRQLVDLGRARAAEWPTVEDAVASLASAYAEIAGRDPARNRDDGGAS